MYVFFLSIRHQASVTNGNLVPSRDDPEYYNDLPGKVPPDVIANATFLDNVSLKSTSEVFVVMLLLYCLISQCSFDFLNAYNFMVFNYVNLYCLILLYFY